MECVTHNPQSIELQGLLVEVLDFLKPPRGCAVAEEVGERGVGSVQLGTSEAQENSHVREGSVSLTNTNTCTGGSIGAAGSVGQSNRTSTWVSQSRDSSTVTFGRSGHTCKYINKVWLA